MPTLEVKIRPIKAGFIVSYCKQPDTPQATGMSDYTEEFCADPEAIKTLLSTLALDVAKSARATNPTADKNARPWNTVVQGPGILDTTVLDGTSNCEGYFQ